LRAVGHSQEARFQDWGLWPVGWAHGQSFFFQFVALGQVKRPSRRRASFGEVGPGKGWFEGRLQGRFGLWFGWSRFGSAIKPFGLRELWPSDLRWQAVTRRQRRFGLQFVAIFKRIFKRIIFGSTRIRPAFGAIVSFRHAFALGFKPTIKFIRSNGFRPSESAFREF
jgi:hypothetical protein